MKVGSVAYRRFALSLAAVLAGVGLFGLTACDETLDQAAAVTGTTEVEVHDNVFEPRVIEVQAGTEVTWTWVGDPDHNVVGERFQSTVQAEGEFVHRFDRTGSFDYVCTLHAARRHDGTGDGRPVIGELHRQRPLGARAARL